MSFQTANKCVLCATALKFGQSKNIFQTQVSKSEKTIKLVLSHLLKCIKKNYIFPKEAAVCEKCYAQLVRYDNVMVMLMKTQKELSQMLGKSLMAAENAATSTSTNDSSVTIEIMDDDFDSVQDGSESSDDDNLNSNKDQNRTAKLKCTTDDCNRSFFSQRSFELHRLNDHATFQYTEYKCQQCSMTFRHQDYLDLHMNTHNNKNELECRFCDKKFTRKCHVIRHMQVHYDRKQFQCEKCGETFSQKWTFYTHNLKHEAEEKPQVCEICNKVFISRKTLNSHMRKHRSDRKRFPCGFCEKTFTERFTMVKHVRTNHDSSFEAHRIHKRKPEVIEPCIICGERVDTKQQLDAHMEREHDVVLGDRRESISSVNNLLSSM